MPKQIGLMGYMIVGLIVIAFSLIAYLITAMVLVIPALLSLHFEIPIIILVVVAFPFGLLVLGWVFVTLAGYRGRGNK